MRLADFSMPLEGLRLYYALLGLVHTTSSTGGFDYHSIVNTLSIFKSYAQLITAAAVSETNKRPFTDDEVAA